MKTIRTVGLIVLGLLLVLSIPALKSWNTQTKTAEAIKLIEGRALLQDSEVRLSFPGTRILLATNAPEMSLNFDATQTHPDNAVDYQINDGEWKTHFVNGRSRLDLTSDEKGEGVEVNIVRRSEAWQGDVILSGASAEGGFIKPTPLPKTKLLFIGDSITAGAGTTSRLNNEGEREAVSNARLAYPRILGTRLNTQVHQIAYGGRGLVRDWQGITDTNNAPKFYDRVLPDQAMPIWDPADYQADIVSVMLGTNDFNQGIPDRESWTQAYKDFVARIRSDYPKAQIFLISSPMTGGEKGDALKALVREVAESFETPKVQYLQVSQYKGEAWDSHPNTAEHEMIADDLEPAFRAALEE